jgi:hypothetical protein
VATNALPALYLSADPDFPKPDDTIVSPQLVIAFAAVLKTHFPKLSRDNLYDCAIAAAFLQSKNVFDALFEAKGDSLLFNGYLDTLCEEKPVKNILMRTFCRLMGKYGFNPEYHTVTFTGDAGGSFGAVVKNKFLFKDMIGWQHGQYTHTLQWFGICLLYDTPDLCPGYKFTMTPGDLYAYMVSRRTQVVFPGELVAGQAKEFSSKSIWDFCVDCFRDIARLENPLLNLYTSSYRSPANITTALLAGGSLCNTFMGVFMQRRAHKYHLLEQKYQGSKNFQKLAQKLQMKKKRELFNANNGKWIKQPGQGAMVRVWTDPNDKKVQETLQGPILDFHSRTANQPNRAPVDAQALCFQNISQGISFHLFLMEQALDELEKIVKESMMQDLSS